MGNRANLKSNSERTPKERKELARKAGVASGKARRERKTIADALRQVMDEPSQFNPDLSRLDDITIKVVKKMADEPDIRDLKVLAEILGELKQTIETTGLTLSITASKTGKSNIEKIIGG